MSFRVVSAVALFAQTDPAFLDQASRTFWLMALLMAAFFGLLVAATFIRRASRLRQGSSFRLWSEEDLFDPDDVAELSLRLELTEAATKANINRATVDRLFDLAEGKADVVLARSEPITEQNGGRRQLLTVIFEDSSVFKLVADADADTSAFAPSQGLRLENLTLSESGRLVLVFKTRRALIALEVLEAATFPAG